MTYTIENKKKDNMNKKMMNKWIFGAALLLFAACTQDELTEQGDTLPEGIYPLEISSVTLEAEVSTQPWGEDDPQTRVSENNPDRNSSKWDGGEVITVQLGDNQTTTYKVVNADGTLELMGDRLYWAKRTDDVTAWYTSPEYDNGNGIINLADQSQGLAYVLQATAEKASCDSPVSLDFTHQLAKVRVKLAGEKAGSVIDVKIESCTSCTNTNGTVEGDETSVGEITMYKTTLSSNENCWEANVVPGKEITTFRVNGGEWVDLSTEVTPVKGKLHEITIDVKQKVTEINLNTLDKPYEIKEGGKYILTGETTQRIIINADATVVLKGVTINSTNGAPIQISGNHTATLMLEDNNNTLTAPQYYSAILPDEGSTVVIDGNGKLMAQGGTYGAGIGASNNDQSEFMGNWHHAGHVRISGGIIEANGGMAATGIGCSHYANCQGIEISGGNVTAKPGGGYSNPAIGSCTADYSKGKCSSVTLMTCTINAYVWYDDAVHIVANEVKPNINNPSELNGAEVKLNKH